MKKFARFFGILLVSYLGICLFMYLQQDQLLYHPSVAPSDPLPPHFVLDRVDQDLIVWHQTDDKPNAVIYVGGNGEAVERTMGYLASAVPEVDMYFMSYRGYSGNQGKPSEKANIEDVIALFDHLTSRYTHISVIGRSMGSAIAIALAKHRNIHQLVLVTPFDSMASIAQDRYPWLPIRFLIRDSYQAIDWLKGMDRPVLVFTAELDMITPKSRSQPILNVFKPSQLMHVYLKGVNHNNLTYHPYYLTSIHAFLAKKLPK